MLILRKFREDDEEEFIKIMFKVTLAMTMVDGDDDKDNGTEKLVNNII